jgi:hypothetical protein
MVLVGCGCVEVESCPEVGEDKAAGCADWVKTAKVIITCVATAPESIPPGVAAPGKLQAHRQQIKLAETNSKNGCFIGKLLRAK